MSEWLAKCVLNCFFTQTGLQIDISHAVSLMHHLLQPTTESYSLQILLVNINKINVEMIVRYPSGITLDQKNNCIHMDLERILDWDNRFMNDTWIYCLCCLYFQLMQGASSWRAMCFLECLSLLYVAPIFWIVDLMTSTSEDSWALSSLVPWTWVEKWRNWLLMLVSFLHDHYLDSYIGYI